MTDNVRAIQPAVTDLHMELGVSTSPKIAATLYDDFLPQLTGAKALKVWREMSTNDATVASILFAITMLCREVDWRVEPGDESTQAKVPAEFLTEQLHGLTHPFSETVGEAVTALPYGFSFHEIVYTQGHYLGWERFAHRPQSTLLKWVLDDHLRPTGFVQAMPRGQTVTIPLHRKGFLYRMDTTVPSGTPILRGAYRSWYLKKRAEEHLMIGMSRNLQGLPMIRLPAEVLAEGPGNVYYDAMKDTVTRVKRDEQMGLLMPSDRIDGELMYEFTLVSPDADPHFDQVVNVIRMFAGDIAATVLAQFVGLGRDAVGSRALAEPQQDLFQTALGAVLDVFEEAFNRQAVKALFELNPQITGPRPRLVHGEIRDVDLKGLGEFLLKTAQAGAEWFDDDTLMNQLRGMAGFDAATQVQ